MVKSDNQPKPTAKPSGKAYVRCFGNNEWKQARKGLKQIRREFIKHVKALTGQRLTSEQMMDYSLNRAIEKAQEGAN